MQTHTYSIEYTWNNLVVAGEYYTQKFDQEMGGIARNWTAESYYVSASYRFTDLFSVGAYYSIYYPDKDDKDGDALVAVGRPDHKAWEKDLVLSLRSISTTTRSSSLREQSQWNGQCADRCQF